MKLHNDLAILKSDKALVCGPCKEMIGEHDFRAIHKFRKYILCIDCAQSYKKEDAQTSGEKRASSKQDDSAPSKAKAISIDELLNTEAFWLGFFERFEADDELQQVMAEEIAKQKHIKDIVAQEAKNVHFQATSQGYADLRTRHETRIKELEKDVTKRLVDQVNAKHRIIQSKALVAYQMCQELYAKLLPREKPPMEAGTEEEQINDTILSVTGLPAVMPPQGSA